MSAGYTLCRVGGFKKTSVTKRWTADGEFCEYPAEHKSTLSGDHSNARTIIYTTKCHCIPQIRGLTLESPVAMIGGYGLPVSEDLALLFPNAKSINRIFMGDADPADILIFSWLREHVPILWYGVTMIFSFGMTT